MLRDARAVCVAAVCLCRFGAAGMLPSRDSQWVATASRTRCVRGDASLQRDAVRDGVSSDRDGVWDGVWPHCDPVCDRCDAARSMLPAVTMCL